MIWLYFAHYYCTDTDTHGQTDTDTHTDRQIVCFSCGSFNARSVLQSLEKKLWNYLRLSHISQTSQVKSMLYISLYFLGPQGTHILWPVELRFSRRVPEKHMLSHGYQPATGSKSASQNATKWDDVTVPGRHLSRQNLGSATGQGFSVSLHFKDCTTEDTDRLQRRVKAKNQSSRIWDQRRVEEGQEVEDERKRWGRRKSKINFLDISAIEMPVFDKVSLWQLILK